MGLMGCMGCDGVYAVGLPACPVCGMVSPRYEGSEDGMPKVTIGGASNAWEEAPQVVAPSTQDAAAPSPVEVRGEPGPELADPPYAGVVTPLPQGWAPDPGAPAPAPDYGSMTQAALRDEAKSRGLPVSGSKADLGARLVEYDAADAAPVAEEAAGQQEPGAGTDGAV